MPLGDRPPDDDARTREGSVLSAAAAVVTTSAWARRRLLELYALPADRLHVAQPAVDLAELASGTATGGALLCVAAVTFDKGHDVLVDALTRISDLSWSCVCVGRLDRDPEFVDAVRRGSADGGLGDRVQFPGPRSGAELDRSYAAADVMVLASRAETYGMVVIEALARGLPVIAADVGGLTEAVGHGADGIRPGLLIAPDDVGALAAALRSWLGDAQLRARLRRAAVERRESLPRLVEHRIRPRSRPDGGVAMSDQVVRVSDDWLALREPADAAARSRELVEHLGPPATGRWVIHDLGGGTGSMGRWLAPLLPGPQRWVVHDRDTELLALAAGDVPGRPPTAPRSPSRHGSPTSPGCSPSDLSGATLVTASALLDMLTEDELAGLVSVCAGAGCPVLLTLSVVGRVGLTPADPLDGRVAAAFNDHQRRPTQRGRLLGPDAVAAAAEQFGRLGVEVLVRPSPWRLGASHAELADGWFTGWVGAACEQRPSWPPRPRPTRAGAWRRRQPESSRSPSTTPTCWRCLARRGQPVSETEARARSAAARRRRSGGPRRASRAGRGSTGNGRH